MAENDTKLAVEFFQSEIEKNKKSTRMGLIVGGVLGALLLVYFVMLMNMVNTITDPDELADFVGNQASMMLPETQKGLSDALQAAAPELIGSVVDEVVKLFPELRKFAEDELKKLTTEALKTAKTQLDEVYREVLVSAKARVVELEAAGQRPSPQIFLDELKKEINTQITNKITSRPEESVFVKLEKTHEQLVRIEKKLRRLAKNDDPNRSELLEKRLIQSWMLMLEDSVRDVDSEDIGNIRSQNMPKKDVPAKAAEKKAAPAKAPAKTPAKAPAAAQK